jgi:predicted amidophosphoribosyltransferase
VDYLVPIPLHGRRRRVRGFNQAEILARLAAPSVQAPVLPGVLVRRRNTGQQAKIASASGRGRNLESAFAAPPRARFGGGGFPAQNRILLVDDLVTSGCTAAAAARCLRAAGWRVQGILALGLAAEAKNKGPRVDTWEGGF